MVIQRLVACQAVYRSPSTVPEETASDLDRVCLKPDRKVHVERLNKLRLRLFRLGNVGHGRPLIVGTNILLIQVSA